MYLENANYLQNAFKGVSLLLKAERGDSVGATRYNICGSSIRGKSTISKMGSGRLRQALYFPAIVAKNHNPLFTKFAQKLGSKAKPTKVIIVAIMRKLLHIVFGVVKNNTPFNPNFLLDS